MKRKLLLGSALLLMGCVAPTPPPALPPGDVPAAFEQSQGAAAWPGPDW